MLPEESPEGLCPVVLLELHLDGGIAALTQLSALDGALSVVRRVGPQHVGFMSRYAPQGECPHLASRRIAACQMHVRTDGFASEPRRIRWVVAEKGRGDVQHHLARGVLGIPGPAFDTPPEGRRTTVRLCGRRCLVLPRPTIEGSLCEVLGTALKRCFVPFGLVSKAARYPNWARAVHLALRCERARAHPRIGNIATQCEVRESVPPPPMLLGGTVSQITLPFVRQLLRHHVLDRQMVTGRRFLTMLRFHQRAQNRKGSASRGATVRATTSDPLPDCVVVGYPDTRVPKPPDPSKPVIREVLARTRTGTVGEFCNCLVQARSRPIRQPQPSRPSPDPRKGPGELFVHHPRSVILGNVIEEP